MRYKITRQNQKDYEEERRDAEREAQHIYCAIQSFYHHKANQLHEKEILNLVGKRGLEMLRQFHLIKANGNGNYVF